MDRLDAMRAFVAVADLGSFAEAARRLRLSPAAMTRAVVLLEDQLGLTLLHRTTRSVRLTQRGTLYLETCRQLLDDLAHGEQRARGEDAAPRGLLTVAAPVLFGRLHVLPIVEILLREQPALSVRLTLSDRNVHLVEEGIDVAVRIGPLADSALRALRLGTVQRVLVASPGYLAERGVPDTPAALADHDLVAFEGLENTNDWRFGAEDRTSVRIEPRLAVNGADAAIAAAEAGLGITRALSYQVRAGIEAGRLQPVLQEHALPPVPINLVYAAKRLASPNLAAFIAVARRRFQSHPIVSPGATRERAGEDGAPI